MTSITKWVAGYFDKKKALQREEASLDREIELGEIRRRIEEKRKRLTASRP